MRERAARELAQLVSIVSKRAELALARRVPVELEQALALRERFELEPAGQEQVLALREGFELEPELRKPEQASLAQD